MPINKAKSPVCLLLFFATFCHSSCGGTAPMYTLPNASSGNGRVQQEPSITSSDFRARFSESKIVAQIYPRRNEGYIDMALRISNQPKQWQKLKSWNRNRRFPQVGMLIEVPYTYLNKTYRLAAIEYLFKKDKFGSRGWEHVVTFRGETMWFIAETFTGDGANYPEIQKANNLSKGQAIALGQRILIPLSLLGDEFASSGLPEIEDLSFEKKSDGKVDAIYVLRDGEALYSSVVVRFTGRVDADDVNEMAERIMRYNGITDPTKIPTGKKIRIPFEYLSDDFVTGGAPSDMMKLDRTRPRGRGLHVIIDPGHGGSDPGVIKRGIAEDELAYDVMLRLKNALERQGVNVYTTVEDLQQNGSPQNSTGLKRNAAERVKTTPPYVIRDARVSVNLRVYLVNAIYKRLKARGVQDKDIFFVSLHMDHLHPSMQGCMIYYPGEEMRSKTYQARGRIYGKYAESRNSRITFASAENRKAASFSYDFSREVIRALMKKNIPVNTHRPIRPYVYRRNRKWTPAVVRYSKVPNSILVEVVNMANSRDFSRIIDYRFRQRVAEALAAAIL